MRDYRIVPDVSHTVIPRAWTRYQQNFIPINPLGNMTAEEGLLLLAMIII